MTAITHTQVNEKQSLQPVSATGWRRGLGNLFRKEMSEWFGTRKWLVQMLIWFLLVNGITTIILVTGANEGAVITEHTNEVVSTFPQILIIMVGIGLVISFQGAIIGEKQLGTAAWVMSKPASRQAFIVAKAAANIIGYGLTGVIAPTAVFLLETRFLVPLSFDMAPFLSGLVIVSVSLLFYLMLTLMLGTVFNGRGAITGIGIGLLLFGQVAKGFVPQTIQLATPWPLMDVAAGLSINQPLPDIWPIPVAVCAVWIVIFSAIALWRFGLEEF
jgi:ABC-2 type transport system permease protein